MVIYTAALQEAQPNRLYTRLPGVNQHKIAIYTAAVPEPIQIYTRQPCIYHLLHEVAIYTAAIPDPIQIYTRQLCIYPLPHEVAIYTAAIQDSSRLYTLQPGAYKNRYLHGSRSKPTRLLYIAAGCINKIVIYTAAVQEPIQAK